MNQESREPSAERGGTTKAERDARVAEALDWMQEDGLLPAAMGKRAAGSLAKFPGWTWDEATARALLESSLVAYPELRLLPCLADFRMRWIPKGPASRQGWMARWRNWLRKGTQFGDPLVVGRITNDHQPQTIDHGPSSIVNRRSSATATSREGKEAELTADQIRTWHDQPWAR